MQTPSPSNDFWLPSDPAAVKVLLRLFADLARKQIIITPCAPTPNEVLANPSHAFNVHRSGEWTGLEQYVWLGEGKRKTFSIWWNRWEGPVPRGELRAALLINWSRVRLRPLRPDPEAAPHPLDLGRALVMQTERNQTRLWEQGSRGKVKVFKAAYSQFLRTV